MPPRAVKRTPAAGPGSKRGGRGGRGKAQAQPQVHPVVEEPVKVEEPPTEVKEEAFEEKTPPPLVVEEKDVAEPSKKVEPETEPEVKSEGKRVVSVKSK